MRDLSGQFFCERAENMVSGLSLDPKPWAFVWFPHLSGESRRPGWIGLLVSSFRC